MLGVQIPRGLTKGGIKGSKRTLQGNPQTKNLSSCAPPRKNRKKTGEVEKDQLGTEKGIKWSTLVTLKPRWW